MQEIYKQALMHQQAMDAREPPAKGQDWGITAAVDDIRTKVVEEPYWLRPEGRAVTDNIQPSTMREFYQSHSPAESEPASMQDLYQSHMPEQETPEHEHVYSMGEDDKEQGDNCMVCGQSMDTPDCEPDPERVKELEQQEEERGMDL